MWPFNKLEHRASATDAIVSSLLAQAGGSSVPPSVEALGAVEAAAGLWSRAFASATVEPSTTATRALTPSVLAAIGRGLAVRGEVVFALDVNGTVELLQASSVEGLGRAPPGFMALRARPAVTRRRRDQAPTPRRVGPTHPLRNSPPCSLGRGVSARHGI